MPFKMHTPLRHIRRAGLLFTALAASTTLSLAQSTSGIGAFVPNTELGFSPVAAAGEPRINWINGEYQESHTDMSVKVLGARVDIARSWSQGRWWLNPAWAPLNFELDPLGRDAKTIERAGVIYERSGQSDLYIAKSKGSASVYIKALQSAAGQVQGWQWYDRLWEYAWAHMIDHVHGAWFRILDRRNRKYDEDKSPAGKTDYHTMGACHDVLSVLRAHD